MEQTRLVSFIEANMNVISGFFISLAVWILIVVPLYDLEVSYTQNLEITGIFTLFSVSRAYVIRRFFNNGWHLVAQIIATKIKRVLT
jgi:hypothetical protein